MEHKCLCSSLLYAEQIRSEMKKMLHNLYHNYPTAKDNFLLMLHNPSKLDLWNPIEKEPKE